MRCSTNWLAWKGLQILLIVSYLFTQNSVWRSAMLEHAVWERGLARQQNEEVERFMSVAALDK